MRDTITISLCMIVRDEEEVLARCLDSVRDIADEIVLVDTGSTDATKEIAARYAARVFDFSWIDDFAAARNYAFEQATQEYILWLDADDVLLEEDRSKFLALKRTLDPTADSVSMFYVLSRDGQGRPITRIRRNRLVKRERGFRWVGPVHEFVDVNGSVTLSDIAVTHSRVHHKSDRNIGIYERRLAAGEAFGPRDLFYYANELREHDRWQEALDYYERFLATKQGWVEDNLAACRRLYECCHQLGRVNEAMPHLLRSLEYDIPRPYVCCRIGDHFVEARLYTQAVYWYQAAVVLGASEENTWGLRDIAQSTSVPHLQLCVCYDRLKDTKQAALHNEKAALYLPEDDNRVEYNRRYFEGLLGKAAMEEARRAARPPRPKPAVPATKSHHGSPAPPQKRHYRR